jgi:2Fe-2S ferredoxin
MNRLRKISFKVNIQEEVYFIETYFGEYRNLMILLYDKFFVDGFGECKGIGRCGTCHVRIIDYDGELLQKEGNESTTLSRMDGMKTNSRLSCQILIDEKIQGLQFEIINDNDPLS